VYINSEPGTICSVTRLSTYHRVRLSTDHSWFGTCLRVMGHKKIRSTPLECLSSYIKRTAGIPLCSCQAVDEISDWCTSFKS
jgi:hypothetical protein